MKRESCSVLFNISKGPKRARRKRTGKQNRRSGWLRRVGTGYDAPTDSGWLRRSFIFFSHFFVFVFYFVTGLLFFDFKTWILLTFLHVGISHVSCVFSLSTLLFDVFTKYLSIFFDITVDAIRFRVNFNIKIEYIINISTPISDEASPCRIISLKQIDNFV